MFYVVKFSFEHECNLKKWMCLVRTKNKASVWSICGIIFFCLHTDELLLYYGSLIHSDGTVQVLVTAVSLSERDSRMTIYHCLCGSSACDWRFDPMTRDSKFKKPSNLQCIDYLALNPAPLFSQGSFTHYTPVIGNVFNK